MNGVAKGTGVTREALPETFSPRAARLTVQIATQISSVATTHDRFLDRCLINDSQTIRKLRPAGYRMTYICIFDSASSLLAPSCIPLTIFNVLDPISTDVDLLRREK